MTVLMVEPGTTLLGKYHVERVLGRGGMGVVLLARHLMLDQRVAIKCLLPEMLERNEVLQRFHREAQSASKLTSEHVCRVFDVGVLDDGAPYMVMEYLEGQDLGQLYAQSSRLEPGMVVDFMLQACEALAEAHALGIVHRDLKPANFFITRRADGSPLLKVLDFGISKAPVAVDEGLTSTQAVMGTPSYMSPEQMRSSKQVDPRSDVWALGVMLYELIEGRRPFRGGSFSDLCLVVAMDPPAPPRRYTSPGLESVIMRCLEKAPEERFQNVAELAAALAPFAQTPAQATSSTARTSRILNVDVALTAPDDVARPPAEHPPAEPVEEPPTASLAGPPSTLMAGMIVETPTGTSVRRKATITVMALAAAGALAAGVLALVFTSSRAGAPKTGAREPALVAPMAPADAGVPDAAVPAASPSEEDAGAAAEVTSEPERERVIGEDEPKKRSERSRRKSRKASEDVFDRRR